MADQTPFEAYSVTINSVVKSIVSSMFIADYGVVTKVYDDKKHVDVKHAIIGTLKTNEVLDPYESFNVELLTISNASMTIVAPPAVGDPVLLIGLKDFVESTSTIFPSVPTSYTHYNQATIKAIPLGVGVGTTGIEFGANNGKAHLKNSSKSLYTILDNIANHCKQIAVDLQTATTIPAVAGSPLTFNPATIANFTTDASNLATDAADLSALLEA